jgi:potassium-transporting ATPase ATP-binding subunit
LAEEKKYTPPLMEKIITAQKIDFSAETKFSGIEFIADKRRPAPLTKEQEEELESYTIASDSIGIKRLLKITEFIRCY